MMQAMREFKKMFPDIPDVVIEAALRENKGQVEDTIDQLLTMGSFDDDKNSTVR